MSQNAFDDNRRRKQTPSETSDAAAESINPEILRYKILRELDHLPEGSTCDEMEQILDMRHQTCSARFSEMFHEFGYIKKLGVARRTRSGRWAEAYVLTDLGRSVLLPTDER